MCKQVIKEKLSLYQLFQDDQPTNFIFNQFNNQSKNSLVILDQKR